MLINLLFGLFLFICGFLLAVCAGDFGSLVILVVCVVCVDVS